MSIIALGTMAFDALETPFGKTDKIVGGSATYVAYSASYFYTPVKQISIVGGDFPQQEFDELSSRGVEFEGVEIKKDEKTFFWSGRYHMDMNTRDTLVTELNVLENFDPTIPETYQDCEYLMLGNLSPDVQEKVIDQLKSRPKLIVLDTMNFWMEVAMEDLAKVLKKVDVLMVNDAEARQLSGEFSLAKAAKKILEMGPRYIIIKKGEHGALLFDTERIFSAPALPLEEVYDPTGAGDTFAGGFIGYLAQQDRNDFDAMKDAIIVGSAMASFTVEKFGTERLKNLTKAEIKERVDSFRELTDYSQDIVFNG